MNIKSSFNLKLLRDKYLQGENISEFLRLNSELTKTQIIEISYELQAGSYSSICEDDLDGGHAYASKLYEILNEFMLPGDKLLDCGAGELNTLSSLSTFLPPGIELNAFDISLTRLLFGRRYASSHMRGDCFSNLNIFSAQMNKIPLQSNSIDIILTTHALEPNRGMEEEIIQEMARVSRKFLCLFEPSYELNSMEGKKRMDSLGYIKNLEVIISSMGLKLIKMQPIKNPKNPLNPTCAYVVDVRDHKYTQIQPPEESLNFICPITNELLSHYPSYLWSHDGGFLYPIVDNIPCLRPDFGIIKTNDV